MVAAELGKARYEFIYFQRYLFRFWMYLTQCGVFSEKIVKNYFFEGLPRSFNDQIH